MKRGRAVVYVTITALLAIAAACVGDEADHGGGGADDAGQDTGATDAGVDGNMLADGSGTTDAAPDVDATAPACNPKAPFGMPTLVSGDINGSAKDDGFWLLPDELTVFTTSTRAVTGSKGGFDVFTGTRADRNAAFSTLALVASASTDGDDRAPSATADGKTLYFTRNPPSTGSYDIYVATRNSTTVDFDPPQLAAAPLNGPTNDFVSWVSNPEPSGNYRVYFSSDRPGAASFDLFVTTHSTGGFGAQMPIPALSSPDQDTKVVLTPDELQAFVSSNRTGGIGGQDIWYASRSDTNQGFSTPVAVVELNTADDDLPMWVSPDGCALYFSSRRPGGPGESDVFVAKRGK